MTSDQSRALNPPFQTPKPSELQSQENRKATLQRVSEKQDSEAKVVNSPEENKSGAADAASLLEDINSVADRHISRIDSPPG